MSQPALATRMRPVFAELLHRRMAVDERIVVLTADLGYRMWDRIRDDFPGRFFNVGAAEQAMTGMAVGLALEGKVPVIYSITPFLLYRPFETVRNYIHHERIPVKMVAAGRGRDYARDGFSHWAEEDRAVLAALGNIEARWPADAAELPALVEEMLTRPLPYYINLTK